jgi:outer membrane protein TolC
MRLASDTLKRIMNDPDLPLVRETLIDPVDNPVDLPVTYSYLDAISTAMQERPEMIAALSNIDDATIRQRVADNARLPVLNLLATLRYNGLGDDALESYDTLTEGDYIDYLVSLQFEQPLGNRFANALADQRMIEKTATVLNYKRTAQDITLEVKDALRGMQTAYRLVGANRASRRAAADNLRTLQVQEEAGGPLSPEFIDLKLRREEAVADAQILEVRAIADYNIAIARYYQTLGTLLDRNGITLVKEDETK